MRWIGSLLCVLTIALGVSGKAHAERALATAPVALSDDCPVCRALNVGSKPVAQVTVEVIRVPDGANLGSATCSNLAPNAYCMPAVGCLGSYIAYCKVTVKGSRKAIRAALMPEDEIHGPIVVLPAE